MFVFALGHIWKCSGLTLSICFQGSLLLGWGPFGMLGIKPSSGLCKVNILAAVLLLQKQFSNFKPSCLHGLVREPHTGRCKQGALGRLVLFMALQAKPNMMAGQMGVGRLQCIFYCNLVESMCSTSCSLSIKIYCIFYLILSFDFFWSLNRAQEIRVTPVILCQPYLLLQGFVLFQFCTLRIPVLLWFFSGVFEHPQRLQAWGNHLGKP